MYCSRAHLSRLARIPPHCARVSRISGRIFVAIFPVYLRVTVQTAHDRIPLCVSEPAAAVLLHCGAMSLPIRHRNVAFGRIYYMQHLAPHHSGVSRIEMLSEKDICAYKLWLSGLPCRVPSRSETRSHANRNRVNWDFIFWYLKLIFCDTTIFRV